MGLARIWVCEAAQPSSRREEEAMSLCIVDDEQRRDWLGLRTQIPQSPCGWAFGPSSLWIPAARGHLRRWCSSTMYTDIACVAPPCICPAALGTRCLLILGQAPRSGLFMMVCSEAAQTGMATRRIWQFSSQRDRGPRRHTRQYVEEPDRAQRCRHARIRRRSRSFMNNPG